MYERTGPPGTDSGVEPLIAVCTTEERAQQIERTSSSRGRYASWEEHPLRGAAGRTPPLVGGEVVHVVLVGGGADDDRDPVGVAVFTARDAADRRAAEERRRSGDADHHVVSLPVGWRSADWPGGGP